MRITPFSRAFVPFVVAAVSFGASGTVGVAAPRPAAVEGVEREAQALAPLTMREVARLRSVTEVAASPDGTRVAYVLSVPRTLLAGEDGPAWAELRVVDGKGNDRPFVSGEVNVERIAWLPDGRSIAFLMKRGKKDDPKALWAISADGGESSRLLKATDDISSYSFSPDGKQVAFLATEATPERKKTLKEKGFSQEIYEEEARPVKVWTAALGEGAAAPKALDLTGSASELHWSPAGDRLALALAPSPLIDDDYMARQIVVIEATTGKVAARVGNAGKLGSIEWSPDGATLAFLSGADLNDPDVGSLMVVPATGGNPREISPGSAWGARAISWREQKSLLLLVHEGVWSRLLEVRPGEASTRTVVAPGRAVFTRLSASRDGRAIALVGGSPGHPPEVFLQGAADAEPVRLTDSNPWLANHALGSQEVVSFKARDGLALEGVLIRPLVAPPGGRAPLIVVVHGGPESHFSNGWLTGYADPGQVAAGNGYAVFYPNYRGSTGRGIAFAKLGQGDPAGKEFDDLVDGVDHLVAIGVADKAKVGITGGSYGGYATAWGATYYSDRFAAAVMMVGISDLVSKLGTTDIANEEFLVHARNHPWDDWKFVLERSPIYHSDRGRTPILILHGKDDPRVFPGQSLELYRYLKLRGRAPVRLVLYPGEKHGNRRAASRYDYSLRLMQWMDHYLKGPGGAPPPPELDYGLETEP